MLGVRLATSRETSIGVLEPQWVSPRKAIDVTLEFPFLCILRLEGVTGGVGGNGAAPDPGGDKTVRCWLYASKVGTTGLDKIPMMRVAACGGGVSCNITRAPCEHPGKRKGAMRAEGLDSSRRTLTGANIREVLRWCSSIE